MSKKITTNDFKNRVADILGDKYLVIGEYVNKNTKIEVRHLLCNNTYFIRPHNFNDKNKNRCSCPYCKPVRTMKYTKNEVELIINNALNVENEYEVLDYVSNKKNMSVKHKCGLVYQVSLSNFKNSKSGCPNCDSGFMRKNYGLHQRKSIDEIQEIMKKYNPEFELLTKYRLNRNNYEFKHSKCNSIFNARMSDALQPNSLVCPKCKKRSKYEIKIRTILDKYNIFYYEQKTFKGCYYQKALRYDFYLPDYNICIEYDGEMHDNAYYGEKKLELQKIRDEIKTNYCKDNNITLIRISYKETRYFTRTLINKLKKSNKELKVFLENSTTIENIDDNI